MCMGLRGSERVEVSRASGVRWDMQDGSAVDVWELLGEW